jgi:fibronectin-binding autotransporter adhesin
MNHRFMKRKNNQYKSLVTLLLAGVAIAELPSALAALPGHNISAGSISVVQNDPGNTTNSVTVSLALSIHDFRIRDGSSRGDYNVQIGPDAASNFTNGILMSSVRENGRDNGEGTTNIYCVSMIENERTNVAGTSLIGAYFIPVNNAAVAGAGNSPEYNINVAGAWFPYTEWLGGFARNSGDAQGLSPTNGGALNEFIGAPGLVLGTHFVDLGSG